MNEDKFLLWLLGGAAVAIVAITFAAVGGTEKESERKHEKEMLILKAQLAGCQLDGGAQ